jgi:hypothetical protein
MPTNFVLHVRSYAPFDRFGVVFHGDGANRKPSTAACLTARIHAHVPFDPVSGVVGKADASSSPSRFIWSDQGKRASPKAKASGVKLSQGVFVQLDAWGSVPYISAAPDIDVRVRMEIGYDGGRLNLAASLSGDQFPNCEVFLEDHRGTRRMVHSFATWDGPESGPAKNLMGNRQRDMGGVCRSFSVDGNGAFL